MVSLISYACLLYRFGVFFDNKYTDTVEFVKRKSYKLLIPYMFWGLIFIFWNFNLHSDMTSLRENIGIIFTGATVNHLPIAGALWFLPTLFWMNIILYYINKICRNLRRSNLLVIASSLMIMVAGMILVHHEIYLPFALDTAIVGIGFMAYGYFLRVIKEGKVGKILLNMNILIFMILFVLNMYLVFVNGEVNFRSGIYASIPLTFFNAAVAAILIWNISRIVNEKKGAFKVSKIVLSSIGENSLIYLCLNQWVISVLKPFHSTTFEHTGG